MNRRKYLAVVGLGASAFAAGCSGGSGENNSSDGGGGSGGANDSGGDGAATAASNDSEDTDASTGSSMGDTDSEDTSAESGGDETESASETEGDTGTESESEDEDTTASESDSGSNSGGSASVSDSGDTDVSIKSTDVADGFSLDSAAYYNEDYTNGVRGEVTNNTGSSASYVEIDVYFYDDGGTRLGEGLDNATDLADGETYSYDAIGALDEDKADAVTSYSIKVSNGF